MRSSRILAIALVMVPMIVPAGPLAAHATAIAPAAVVAPAGSPLTAAALPVGASKYVAVAPQRLADTRRGSNGVDYQNLSASTMRVPIIGRAGVPSDATAAVLNVTIVGPAGWSYATVYPGATGLPNSSSLNADGPGRVIANLVHVKIGTDGAANVYRSVAMHILVDLVGVYVPVAGPTTDGRLVTLSGGAQRVLDTRGTRPVNGTEITSVNLASAGIPLSASAVVVTLTAVNANPGFWTAFPDLQNLPDTSSLNLDTFRQTRAAQAIVNLVGTNRFNVFSQLGGDLLVDVVGYFTGVDKPAAPTQPSTDGLYVPSSPTRIFDTRQLRTLPPWSGTTYEFSVGNPSGIQVAAAVLNITATAPWDRGFVTAYPARVVRPNSSNLNVSEVPQTIANQAIVRVSTRGVSLFTQGGSHLIADVAGWYLGVPTNATQPEPPNPVYNPNSAVAVYVPTIGASVAIRSGGGSLDHIADQGFAATWSDINTVAAPGNLMLFGHRTTGAAPFRNLNYLNPGDEFLIRGSDNNWYHYQVMRKDVTRPMYSTIQNLAAAYGPVTAQLVACSKPDGSATSTSYRIVITGRLVSVSPV